MERYIISENRGGIANHRAQMEKIRNQYNSVLEALDNLKIAEPIKYTYKFKELVDSPQVFVHDIYRDKLPDIDPYTGLSINKNARMKEMILPDLSDLMKAIHHMGDPIFLMDNLNYFEMEEGRLVFNEKFIENFNDRYFRIIVQSKKDKDLYDELRKVTKQLNELDSRLRRALFQAYEFYNGNVIVSDKKFYEFIQKD